MASCATFLFLEVDEIRPPGSQLVIPTALRHEALLQAHDSPFAAHFGVHKTYAKLRDKYFWPRMFADVQHYVLSCESCAMKKVPNRGELHLCCPSPYQGPGN